MFGEKVLVFILNVAKKLLFILILILIFGFFKKYISNLSHYEYLKPVLDIEKTMVDAVREYVPTRIAGRDYAQLIGVIGILIVSSILTRISNVIKDHIDKKQMTRELDEIKSKSMSKEQRHTIDSLKERISESSYKSKSRDVLLKEFAEIKKELEKNGRNLAFLAIDVVDSTGMKQKEDPLIIQRDFNEYRNFVSAQFQKYGYVNAAWTPDGVMACFNTIEQAIQAAKSIIEGLKWFNREVKMIKPEFKVRCGINSGFVVYDVTTPLEAFSDRVIDIAGHMQKYAEPNTILVAKEMVEPVEPQSGFIKSQKIVDSLEAYEWNPDDATSKNSSSES